MGAEKTNLLGLRAEKATETARFDPADFHDPGVEMPEAPYLGPGSAATDAGSSSGSRSKN